MKTDKGKNIIAIFVPALGARAGSPLGPSSRSTQVTFVWSAFCAERMDDIEIVSLEVGAQYSALRWSTLTRLRPQRVYESVDAVAEVDLWARMGTLEDQDAGFRARSGDLGSSLVTSSNSSVVVSCVPCRFVSCDFISDWLLFGRVAATVPLDLEVIVAFPRETFLY